MTSRSDIASGKGLKNTASLNTLTVKATAQRAHTLSVGGERQILKIPSVSWMWLLRTLSFFIGSFLIGFGAGFGSGWNAKTC